MPSKPLYLNGNEILVQDGTARRLFDEVGYRGRGVNGAYRMSRQTQKRIWEMGSDLLSPNDSRALVALLNGHGDNWGFDDSTAAKAVYSGKGNGPFNSGGAIGLHAAEVYYSISSAIPSHFSLPKCGAGCASIDLATTNLFSQNVRNGDEDGAQTGFTAISTATIARDTGTKWQGTASLKITTTNTGNVEGVKTTGVAGANSTVYVASVYLLAATGTPSVAVALNDISANATNGVVITATLSTTTWTRVNVTLTTIASATTPSLQLVLQESAANDANTNWWADGFQLEAQSWSTSWVDGARAAAAYPEYDLPADEFHANADLYIGGWFSCAGPFPSSTLVNRTLFTVTDSAGANGIRVYLTTSTGTVKVDVLVASATTTFTLEATAFLNINWLHVAVIMRRNAETGQSNFETYVNGAAQGTSSAAIPAVALNTLVIGNNINNTAHTWAGFVDDLVVLPCSPPAAWVTQWYSTYATVARPYPRLPRLEAEGSLVTGGGGSYNSPINVIPEVVDSQFIQAQFGSVWIPNAQRTSFKLHEES